MRSLAGLKTLMSSGLRCSLRISLNRICFRGIKQRKALQTQTGNSPVGMWLDFCHMDKTSPLPTYTPSLVAGAALIDFSHGTF